MFDITTGTITNGSDKCFHVLRVKIVTTAVATQEQRVEGSCGTRRRREKVGPQQATDNGTDDFTMPGDL